ncbi:cholesterol transporter ABCA5-like [Rhopilema esculentum]|uniref:cholesterol transporter ABCA5-like n=1 Tax=Rhopilema esculentum TaxID=499914 RepID=UPI0031DBA2B8
MTFFNQVKFLLYRNFLLKRRNTKQTVYEAVSVLYFVAILAVIRKTAVQPKTYEALSDSDLHSFALFPPQTQSNETAFLVRMPKEIGYVIKPGSSPPESQKFVEKIQNITGNFSIKLLNFSDEAALENAHRANPKNLTLGMVVYIDAITKTAEYTIKVPYDSVPLTTSDIRRKKADASCRGSLLQLMSKESCPVNTYYASGYAVVQAIVEGAIIEVLAKTSGFLPPTTTIKMMPKPEYTTDLSYLKTVVGIYMVIAFSPYVMFLLTYIVTEKELKIKESMKIMGLSTFAFWFTWFLTYAVIITIGVIFVTIISRVALLYGDSDYFIIFLIFFFYGLSIETLTFVLTPLFKKGRTAGSAGSMATIVLGTLSFLHVYVSTSNAVKWLTGLLSPVALSLTLMSALDGNEGVTWSNIGSKGDFPVSYGLALLFIDTILYLLLAIYLDSVFPGEYGQRKECFFCFKPSFWKGLSSKRDRKPSLFRGHSVRHDEPQADVEELPEHMADQLAISIRGLKKIFKKKKEELKALDGVSLDVYEGQITALLGHNGAGKSTLIAVLTGMLSPTSGSAMLYGNSIRISDDMDKIRKVVGFCPQQNILFPQLTPREHLKIFAGIKGVPTSEINDMVEKTLKEVDLFDKSDSVSGTLSGGQKRKLCVGIALIGDPKVVFLDEPTSGMDPSSRRYIWKLLQGKKENRVIFLTTHFMDEADILADYKAVLSKGKLRCAGSSLYLKSRFGVGYYLSMVTEEDADRDKIVDLVTGKVSGAEMSRVHGKELNFRLPMKSVDQFPDLFASLEEANPTNEPCSASNIGVTSYGVSMTTLEEVFLKLDDDENQISEGVINPQTQESTENLVIDDGLKAPRLSTNDVRVNVPEMQCITTKGLLMQMWLQLTALLEVRFWSTLRSPMKILFQVVIPPIFAIVGLVLLRKTATSGTAAIVKGLSLPPSTYIKQGGVGVSFKDHTEALFQNSTKNSIEDIIQAAYNESLGYSVVDSIATAPVPHDLGFDVRTYDTLNGQATYVVRYNDTSLYSIPVGINTMSNLELIVALKKASHQYSGKRNPISAKTKPFQSLKVPWTYDNDAMAAILLLGLTFAFMPNGFSIEVVKTRQEGLRHQLRVSGVSRWVYWLHFLVGDLLLYIIPTVIVFILIAAFDIKSLNNSTALGCVFLLFLLYNPVSLLFAYVISFAFNKWETIQNVMGTVLMFLALGPYMAVSITDMVSGSIEMEKAVSIVHLVFLILDPPYAVMGGLYFITRIWRVEALIAQDNDVKIPASKYFELSLANGLPITFIVLTIQLFFYSYLLATLDLWFAGGVVQFPFSLCCGRKSSSASKVDNSSETEQTEMNEDVKEEIQTVTDLCNQGAQSDRAVIVEGLRKYFGKKKIVNDVYLDVKRGEIFGLLGPNGAGKTTTLNVMTADYRATTGEVFLDGHSTTSELASALMGLGYCPQIDALWELVTLEEHLKCFTLIKGVPRDQADNLVRHYMDALRIQEHAGTRAGQLSGGTKRKLCFLNSMCGNPNVVLMDEPSTGMDPSSKRFLWNVISANIKGSRGAILTTHSMEEADALCSRVGILVKGRLKCVGTTQELKSNYGGGYTIEIKCMTDELVPLADRMTKVQAFVKEMFPGAVETECFGQRLTYKVPKDDVGKLSEIFNQLEEGKRNLGIEEYSFSQATLEQVFLEFAKEQDEELTGKDEGKGKPRDSIAA